MKIRNKITGILLIFIFTFSIFTSFTSQFSFRTNQIPNNKLSDKNPPIVNMDASPYFISSNWMTQNIIIDGNITFPLEWSDATVLTLVAPKYSFNTTLYFKNNATHLAILCDAIGDETEDITGVSISDFDHFDIGFDTGYDQVQTTNEEDSFTILANGTLYQWEYDGTDYSQVALDNVIGAVNFTKSSLNSNNHEIFEILIRLNTLYTSAGAKIGVTSTFTSVFNQGWIYDNNTGQDNTYPLSAISSDLSTWGTLKMALSPPSSILAGNGTNLPVLFQCENNGIFSNRTETNDFNVSIPTGAWNQTSVDITLENISAPNITYVVEDASASSAGLTLAPLYAQSIRVNNTCYLNNITVQIQPQFGGDNPDGDDILIRVFNATNNGGIPKPGGTPTSGYLIGSTQTHELVEGFIYIYFTFNYTTPLLLNTSKTYDNTFFIMLARQGSITPSTIVWKDYPDPPGPGNDTADEAYVYSGAGTWSSSTTPVDFDLKVSLSPPSNTPKPSEVGIKINGTPVTDVGSGEGIWNSNSNLIGNNVVFDVQSNWTITYDVAWKTVYEKYGVGIVDYMAGMTTMVDWNITTSITFPIDYTAYTINMTFPTDWNATTPIVLNGSSIATLALYDSLHYNWYTSEGIIQIKNMSDQLNYWRIVCTGYNYLTQLSLEKKVASTYFIVPLSSTLNITDTLRINGTVQDNQSNPISEPNSGNLTIYNAQRTIYTENDIDVINGILSFTDWLISADTDEPGVYTIQLVWFNGLEIGMNETTITVEIPTEALKISPLDQYYFIGAVVNEINVTVFYNCTYWARRGGISNVNASYRIYNYSTLWQDWTDLDQEALGFGYYNVSLDYSAWTNGTYIIQSNLNKIGYQSQELNFTIFLVFNTTITLVAPLSTQVNNYYPENLTIQVNYTKATGEEILTANLKVFINETTPLDLIVANNLFTIQLNSTYYGVGNYNVTIIASLLGYYSRRIYIDWRILACPTQPTIYVNSSHSATEFLYGEKMKVTVFYNDTVHNWAIKNALVNLTVTGDPIPKTLTDEGNGNYSIVLDSSSRAAGLWNLSLLIEKPNYQNHTRYKEIYAKYTTLLQWVIAPPSQIHPGDTLLIAVNLTHNGIAVPNQRIMFNFTKNNVPAPVYNWTDANGNAYYEFIIESEITDLSIEIIFQGNITEFSTLISTSTITVIHGGLLERYWWVILLAAILMIVAVAGVRSRRKAKFEKELKKKEIITSFQDVTKILHLVVIHKGTGTDIFDYRIQERLDPTLLAGFIQAVKDFGKQIDQGEQ
ncbi:MAG TPA: hypothetical protein VMV49_07175 [Candidatus Deferrimicrobium sp.]|nr:hypothetical protein [Candidatus Deferrimicrobium sp.]